MKMDNKDELLQEVKTAVGIETPEENTATAIRDSMQAEFSIALGKMYERGFSAGKHRTIDSTLIVLHTFAENLSNKTDKEIVNQCIKLIEMMKEQ